MSYQVLARKWRPGKFNELVGQEHVVSAISNALDNDRLHHAYLFTGTRGVGKTTIARIFSKSLNCEEGQGSHPCGQCNTCKEIEQGNYVDLLEIDAASRTKVEDTRELLDNVQYKPTRGRYKVYLIDEVHMLSKHSFNALLKTLEEPPPHVKFLLATTDPQKLPITILSRCLQFNLKALSREQITGQLTHVLEQEALSFEPQALSLLARAAQGSMRDALSLTDQAIAQGGNAVNAAVVTDMLGLMDKNQLLKLLHSVVSKTPADVMQLVQDMSEQAPDYDNVLAELGSTLHQIALTQWVPEACKLETTSAKAIYQLAKTVSAEQVQLLYQIALQGRKDLPFSADGRSALEMTLMRMMTFAPSTPLADAPSEINNGQSNTALPISATEKKTLTPDDTSAESADQSTFKEDTEHKSATTAANAFTTQEPSAGNEPSADNEPSAGNEPSADTMPFEEMPPPDAYMDDQPPIDSSYGEYHYSHDVIDGEESNQNHASDDVNDTSDAPEVQLTSTADMLALRQRLKQRKEQDISPAEKKTDAVSDSEGLVARMSKASNAARPSPTDNTQDESRFSASETASDTESDEKNHSFSAPNVDDTPPWETPVFGANEPNTQMARNTGTVSYADVPQVSAVHDAQASAEHAPETDGEEVAEIPRDHTEYQRDSHSHDVSSNAELTQPLAEETHLPQADTSTHRGELQAYLPDGSKLVHASQIDSWSNLVEQMPIAGLLKQLVLHASFMKNDQKVTLEIDNSQAHLLNDSAKQQLLDVLHHALGEEVDITLSLGMPSQTPFALQQNIQAMRLAHAHTVVKTDETIQALLSAFDASVVTDSVKAR